jgi:hypothetical protein
MTTIESPSTNSSKLTRKPALPPKPKLNSTSQTNNNNHNVSLDLDDHNLNSFLYKQNYNSIVNSLKHKLNNHTHLSSFSSSSSSSTSSNTTNTISLLDEIYAEIEDKQIKSTLLSNYASSTSSNSSTSCSSCVSSSSNQDDLIITSNNNSPALASVVIVESPPPLPSVPPPPLLSPIYTTPNPLNNSNNELQIIAQINANDLSLEQEIELEIRNKLNTEFLLSSKSNSNEETLNEKNTSNELNSHLVLDEPHDFDIESDFDEENIEDETEYLEPVNVNNLMIQAHKKQQHHPLCLEINTAVTTGSKEPKTPNFYKKRKQLKLKKFLLLNSSATNNDSTASSSNSGSKFLSNLASKTTNLLSKSHSKLNSLSLASTPTNNNNNYNNQLELSSPSNYRRKMSAYSPSRLKNYIFTSPIPKSNSKEDISSSSLSTNESNNTSSTQIRLNNLFKSSGQKLTSTLRLIKHRSQSSHNHYNNNDKNLSTVVDSFNNNNSNNNNKDNSHFIISQPRLISQTFDLNKQSLIEIKNNITPNETSNQNQKQQADTCSLTSFSSMSHQSNYAVSTNIYEDENGNDNYLKFKHIYYRF